MKIALKTPIQVGDSEPITHLTLREAVTAGDMRGIAMREPMHWDDMLKITARLAGQPEAVIYKLSFADTLEVVEQVAGFLGAGLKTGKTVSTP